MISRIRALLGLALVTTASGAAFVQPSHQPSSKLHRAEKTSVAFGFLKELGLEKPDWLPDFGGKKEETTEEPVAEETSEETEGAEEATEAS